MGIRAELCHQLSRIPGTDNIPGARTTTPPQQVRETIYRVGRSKPLEFPVVAQEGQTIIFDRRRGFVPVG